MSFCLSVTGWNVLLLITHDLYLNLNSTQEGVDGLRLRPRSIIRRGSTLLSERDVNRVSELLFIKRHRDELWFLINR